MSILLVPQLLQHVSGLNKTTAQKYCCLQRKKTVASRKEAIKKVPRLGPKAYEQADWIFADPWWEEYF